MKNQQIRVSAAPQGQLDAAASPSERRCVYSLWLNFHEQQILFPDSWKIVELVTSDNQTKPIIPQLFGEVTNDEREFLFGGG